MRKNHKRKWHILCAVMALVLMISNIPILDVHAEIDPGNPVKTEQPSDLNDKTFGGGDVSGNNQGTNTKPDEEEKEDPEESIVPDEKGEEQPVEVKAFLEAVDALWNSDSVNQEELQELIKAVDDAYEALTEEQQAMEDVKAAVLTGDARAYLDAVLALWDIEDAEEQAAALEKIDELYDALTEEQKETVLVKTVQEALGLLDEMEPLVLGATVYVEANDTPDYVGEGTEEKPFTSLAEAVDEINKVGTERAYTIELKSDLVANRCARINSKDITIKGNGHTITRGDSFDTISDNARSWYNPAMVEVCDPSHSIHASLRLEDITLDDGEKTKGTKYSQASTDGKGGNGDLVQDAIIATYDGVAAITLGNNATLKGYGGMSAVRLSGGTLIMESGSLITGGKNCTDKGGGNGPAGAVWIQGGEFTMEEGAKIDSVAGRAVYVDGGSAEIGGTISNIKGNMNMWQNESGVAIHVRKNGYAVLKATGVIENISGDHAGYRGAVMTNGSRGEGLWDFKAEPGSKIRNVTGFPTLYSNYGTELLDGTITGCSNDFIIGGFAQKTTIGENGVIEKCTANKGAARAIVYTSNASKVYLRGRVRNNTARYGFYIINQSGGGASLEMYDGAVISANTETGVYINASECSFMMHGGTIEGNGIYGVYAREKDGRSAKFVMENGRIVNNGSYGVYYETKATKDGCVNITGGEISGNGKYSPYQVYILGANAKDNADRVYIKTGIVKAVNGKEDIIYTSFGQLKNITLGESQKDIYLGNAKTEASNKIKELVAAYETSDAYITRGSALWFKSEATTLHFISNRPSGTNMNNYLWLVYIPLKADGTPVDNAELTVVPVTNAEQVDVTLSGLAAKQPYAMMWMQPNDDATGVLQMTTGTPLVQEEADREEAYTVDYTVTYNPKNLGSSMTADKVDGDILTATIMLDPALTYQEGTMEVSSLSNFEQVGDVEYNAEQHIITFTFRYYCNRWSFAPTATIKFKADFDGSVFDTDIKELKSKVALNVKLKEGREVDLETALPCITRLVALEPYTITFDPNGGSAVENQLVKPGRVVTRPTDPTRAGYTFNGWTLGGAAYDFTTPVTGNITLTAQWTANQTTGGGGGGGTTPVTTPPAPEVVPIAAPAVPLAAPAVVAATPAAPEVEEPAVEVEDEEVPLAAPEEPEEEEEAPLVEMEEPEVPLASGAQWALLNLLLMILTVIGGVVMAIGATRKKEEYDEDNEESRKNSRLLHLFGIVPAIVSAIVFFLTEDMRSPMVFVDKMTVTMICITVVEAAAIVLAYRARFAAKNEQE